MNERDIDSTPPLALDATGASKRSVEHWLVLAAALGGIAVLVVLGTWAHPDARGFGTHEQLGLPKCRFFDWTGIPCPGCGVTTAVAFAARASIGDSLRTQPFGVVVVLGILAFAAWAIRGQLAGRHLYRELVALRVRTWVWSSVIGALAIGWIYKVVVVLGS